MRQTISAASPRLVEKDVTEHLGPQDITLNPAGREILEQLNGMSKIAMEFNTARDRLIVEKTVETRLFYLPDRAKGLVIEALSR